MEITRLAELRPANVAQIEYRRALLREVARRRHSEQEKALKVPQGFLNCYLKDFSVSKPEFGNPATSLQQWITGATRIQDALKRSEEILIFGDYDCDGISSVVLMVDFLVAAGADGDKLSWFIPNRFDHQYGLSSAALDECLSGPKPPRLIITVDCGSNSVDQISTLKGKGIDTVVIDHHLVTEPIPGHPACAIINPKAGTDAGKDEPGLTDLCAAGLVFLFCDGFTSRFQCNSWDRERALIIAGLATYADVVPLLCINRALVKRSISLARDTELLNAKVPGLAGLHRRLHERILEKTGKLPPVDSVTLGFDWGPCINASGRLHEATAPVQLLLARSPEQAAPHVEHCVEANAIRIGLQRPILEQARRQAAAQVQDNTPAHVLVTVGEDWHIGVVGIVAGRLREEFCRPAIACGGVKDQIWQGSGRSIENFDMGAKFAEALAQGKLISAGGHKMAAGLRFSERQRPEFFRWVNENSGLSEEEFRQRTEILAFAHEMPDPRDWYQLLSGLKPFGAMNPELPVILENAKLDSGHILLAKPLDDEPEQISSNPEGIGNAAAVQVEKSSKPKPWGARARFVVEGHAENSIVAVWKDAQRAPVEWVIGRHYTLALEPERRERDGETKYQFRVVNSWQEDLHRPQGTRSVARLSEDAQRNDSAKHANQKSK